MNYKLTLGSEMKKSILAAAAISGLLVTQPALAQSKPELIIGAVISSSGPAASLGVPERKAVELVSELAAKRTDFPFVPKFVLYDDGSDPTRAVNSVRKAVSEDGAAIVICCTTTPASMAILESVSTFGVLNISMASAAAVVEPVEERHWTFKTPMTDRMQIGFTLNHMRSLGVKSVGYLGLEDAYGEAGWVEFRKLVEASDMKLAANERFARADTNFTPQALKVKQGNPDAVYIHGIPPASVLMQQALKRVGYHGKIFHGAGSANDGFTNIGKTTVDGALVVSGAIQVHDQLPDSHPLKSALTEFASLYAKKFPGEYAGLFAGQGWDAAHLALLAAEAAFKSGAKPGDAKAFRKQLRDSMETVRGFVGSNGIFNLSPKDHLGLDDVGLAMLEVKGGKFKLNKVAK